MSSFDPTADFETCVPGKWILCGEHAVVRGHGALLFPLHSKTLTLQYYQTPRSLTIIYQNAGTARDNKASGIINEFIEHAFKLIDKPKVTGELHIDNQIPIRSGLGSSAALSVAISKWFIALNYLTENKQLAFAHELEHFFHGQSSGADVAVVSQQQPIFFQQGRVEPINLNWQPHLCLSNAGSDGATTECVNKVQQAFQEDPVRGQMLDQRMQASVSLACLSLKGNKGYLQHAIKLAYQCFADWGLLSPEHKKHIQKLQAAGAIAAKPTGSGAGGYVLSLWQQAPKNLDKSITIIETTPHARTTESSY